MLLFIVNSLRNKFDSSETKLNILLPSEDGILAYDDNIF